MKIFDLLTKATFTRDMAIVPTAGLPEALPASGIGDVLKDRRLSFAPSLDDRAAEARLQPTQQRGHSYPSRLHDQMHMVRHDDPGI